MMKMKNEIVDDEDIVMARGHISKTYLFFYFTFSSTIFLCYKTILFLMIKRSMIRLIY
jgi:hypothetical protein